MTCNRGPRQSKTHGVAESGEEDLDPDFVFPRRIDSDGLKGKRFPCFPGDS